MTNKKIFGLQVLQEDITAAFVFLKTVKLYLLSKKKELADTSMTADRMLQCLKSLTTPTN